MKEMLEEYGGMIAVCFFALLFLAIITAGTGENGMIGNYAAAYLEGTGSYVIRGGE